MRPDRPPAPDGSRTILVHVRDVTGTGRAPQRGQAGAQSDEPTGDAAASKVFAVDYSVMDGLEHWGGRGELLDGVLQPHVLDLLGGSPADWPVAVASSGPVNGTGQVLIRSLAETAEGQTGSQLSQPQDAIPADTPADSDLNANGARPYSPLRQGESRHYIVAPIRHEGSVLGLLSVFGNTASSGVGEHPIQLLADRVGSSLASSLLGETRDRAKADRLAVADRLLELTCEQRELLEQLVTIETRERALLAEAVHDDPMQLIVAAMMRLDNVRLQVDGELGEELDQVAVVLETSVERLRTVITAIVPPDLSEGLGIALRNLAEGIFLGTTSVVTVTGPASVPLTPLANAAAFGILREALVNTRKHAHARNVTVRLEERGDHVVISVTDDGVGAESLNAERGHIGVATMQARASAENAELALNTRPGRGTTVVLTVPMGDLA